MSNFKTYKLSNDKLSSSSQSSVSLNSGQMSQDQLNEIMPMAQQMYQMMFGGKK